MPRRPRLLPAIGLVLVLLLAAKTHALMTGVPQAPPRMVLVTAAHAVSAPEPHPVPAPAAQPPARPPAHPPAPAPPESPEQQAERALLQSLRARRAELEAREQALAGRELVLAGAERRLAQRIEELSALQARLEATTRAQGEREEAGWRQMVKLYEGMRPRDAATIFDELDLPVLVQLVDRMREAKAAPILGAMRPDRARLLTAELARHRARPPG